MENNITMIEYLIQKNKNMILNSKFQNTIYNNKPLYEYFNEEKKSEKDGPSMNELLLNLVYDIPEFNYYDFIKNQKKYYNYKNLYLRISYKLCKICDLIKHIEKYINSNEIPINFEPKSFFSRKSKAVWLNKETGSLTTKYYDNDLEYQNDFGYLLHIDLENILSYLKYEDYKGILWFFIKNNLLYWVFTFIIFPIID